MSALIADARAAAEARMVDRCEITRPGTGERGYDPVTMTHTDPPPDLVWAGRCKVKDFNVVVVNQRDAAETQLTVARQQVHVPVVGTEQVRTGDTVTITHAEHDQALVDRAYVVSGPHLGTATSARRLPVELVV